MEDVVLTLSELAPRIDLDVVFLQEVLRLDLLMDGITRPG